MRREEFKEKIVDALERIDKISVAYDRQIFRLKEKKQKKLIQFLMKLEGCCWGRKLRFKVLI